MESVGKSGGLLVGWGERVTICQMIKPDFCIEVEIESEIFGGKCWVIFIYASTDEHIRTEQWDVLKDKRKSWGQKWILKGYFNEIISQEDKVGGNMRGTSSFRPFKAFISEMEMGEIVHKGRRWTWANNKKGEGFIEERLDMFFLFS